MTVTGLEQNGYLINNPIKVVVSHPLIYKLEVSILNQSNGKSVTLPNLYSDPTFTKVEFNIEKLIKGLFTEPYPNFDFISSTPLLIPESSNRFSLNFRVTTTEGDTDEWGAQKTFIRGGKYTDQMNLTLPANSVISPTETLPIFNSYPYAYFTLNSQFKVFKTNASSFETPNIQTEIIREKTCNGKYLMFLNSLGGYSFWLFDNWEVEDSSSSLGIVNNGYNQKDLGQNYNSGFKVVGKIPERFYPLMRDLIFSPDIWVFMKEENAWKKIYSDGNKWVQNGAKVAYKVEYKFSNFNNYNPSLI